jgi:hypothetical protein
VGLRVRSDRLEVDLADGRRISVPLSFYPTLQGASPRQRNRWEYLPYATAIEWPDFDLQLSVESIVEGRREHPVPPGFGESTLAAMKAHGITPPPALVRSLRSADRNRARAQTNQRSR